jgi:putative LysE/RhtB family amino acid efflux pump
MTGQLLLQGLAVGAVSTFPLGPIGVICIQRILTLGPRSGLASALGIALGAASWCLVVMLGLGWLTERVNLNSAVVRLLLGGFLIFVAVRNLRRAEAGPVSDANSRQMAGQFGSTLLFVLSNPATVVTVTAVMAAFGVGRVRLDFMAACGLSLAVFAGGVMLWLVLARVLVLLRRRLGEDTTRRVRRAISWFALALGAGYVGSVFF